MNDIAVACLATTPVPIIASRCADRIAGVIGSAAVTLDPEGRVCIEDPDAAAETDIVGVYRLTVGTMTLTRQIAEDLNHEKMARGLVPKVRKHVLSDGYMRQRRSRK